MRHQVGALFLACHVGFLFISGSVGASVKDQLWSPANPHSNSAALTLGLDGRLYLSWIETQSTGYALKFSSWKHGRWSPAEVIAKDISWPISVADTPGMVVLEDGSTIMAHWLSRAPEGYFSTAQLAYSSDGGEKWSDPQTLADDDAWRGVLSWAPLSRNQAGFVWCEEWKSGESLHTRDGTTMALRFSTVSRDGRLGEYVLLDPSVCGACAPELAAGSDGTLVAAYRDRAKNGVSDISCLYFDGTSWSESQPVHADEWRPKGCPLSGPAVDAYGKQVAVAWLTEDAKGRAVVRVAFSKDGGHVFEPPIDVNDANPVGRPDISLFPNGTAWVVWVEETEDSRIAAAKALVEVRLRTVTPDGKLGTPVVIAQTGHVAQTMFPHLARHGDDVYVTWTEAPAFGDVNSPDQVQVARIH